MGAPLLPAHGPPLNATEPPTFLKCAKLLMTDARAFRGFRFPAEVILWAVRWYLRFPISYRDLEAIVRNYGKSG